MMPLALERGFSDPMAESVLIAPLVINVDAHRFDRRLGFERMKECWFDQNQCLTHRLMRADWKG